MQITASLSYSPHKLTGRMRILRQLLHFYLFFLPVLAQYSLFAGIASHGIGDSYPCDAGDGNFGHM